MTEKRRPEPKMPISHYLGDWLEYMGKTQRWLAAELDVEPVTVSRYVSGQRQLSLGVLAAIAEVLGISPLDLYRRPGTASVDAMLVDADADTHRQVVDFARFTLSQKKGAEH